MRISSMVARRRAFAGSAALILATTLGACSHSTTAVTPPPPPPPPVVTSVSVAPSTDSVGMGQTAQMTATGKDASGTIVQTTFTWTSSSAAVATVDGNGLVSGVAVGTATITASVGTARGTATVIVTAAPAASFSHVFVIVLENRNYDSVIGASTWPYLNQLAQTYALATQYSAVTHPSIGNYFMLATGDTLTNDDNNSTVWNVDNLVRHLSAGGKTWTSYAEDLPSVGYVGPDQGNYSRYHNSFALLADVVNSPAQRQNLQPYSQFGTDLAAGRMANYVFILPDYCDDGHNCTDATADNWVRTNVPPIMASPVFQNSLLIITFDESQTWASSNGGWLVPWIMVSPRGKRAYRSTTAYTHAATSRFILQALGLSGGPGAAASAPSMMEFVGP